MDFRRVQIIDYHEESGTQKFSLGGISLVEKAIWINQWTPILLNYNAPRNSPWEFEAEQLSFLFLVKAYHINCAHWLTRKQEEMGRNVPLTRHGCNQCRFVYVHCQDAGIGTSSTSKRKGENYEEEGMTPQGLGKARITRLSDR
jgi:hypothetical protein